ncbi:MAG: DoxX family membrane protein [Parcubacteria group bacterium]
MNYLTLSKQDIGLYLLRFGLVAVYLYFGFTQFMDPVSWSRIVPSWATSLSTLEAVTIVYANASFEIIFALLLTSGFWTKWVSFILGIHLAIITLTMGFTPIGARDFGLTLATFAHGLIEREDKA